MTLKVLFFAFTVTVLSVVRLSSSELRTLDEFTVPYTAADTGFDYRNGRIWLTDTVSKKLVAVSLAERQVVTNYGFAQQPENIAISPDGNWLYLSLPIRPHDSYWFDGREGYVAELSLRTSQSPKISRINEDPYGLAITDDGMLLITSGSGQWTKINSYKPRSASALTEISSMMIRQACPIVFNPVLAAAFTVTTDSYPSDITHWQLDTVGGQILSSWDSPYHGDHPIGAPLWVSPDGAKAFTGAGGVFTLDQNAATDLRHLKNLVGAPFSTMAFDPENKTVFAGSGGSLHQINLETLETALVHDAGRTLSRLFVSGTNLVGLSIGGTSTRFTIFSNPAQGSATNAAPIARFAWLPEPPSTAAPVEFSAGGTTDDGADNELMFRWDWNGDGIFEIPFSTNRTATVRFEVAGTKQVVLEVRDRFGAIGRETMAVNVSMATDYGVPGTTNSQAFGLQFAAANVVVDPLRPFAYASDTARKKVVRVNLATGFIDREFTFSFGPERMTITPDGSRLYVAIPAQPHTYYGGQQRGFVAEIDLASGTRTRVVEIDADPYDIAATDSGVLIISDGSNQWTTLSTHSAATGIRISEHSLYMGARIALTPDQTAVYHVDQGLSPSDLYRHNFTAAGVFTSGWDSVYHGDYPTGIPFPHPDGRRLISSGGSIYSTSTTRSEDLQYYGRFVTEWFNDLAYDTANKAIFTIRSTPPVLAAYNLDSLQEARSLTPPIAAGSVDISQTNLVLTSISASETRFAVIPNPMTGARSNLPPVARFDSTPAAPTTLDRIVLDPSGSTDDGPAQNLQFRWDWNGDGIFDTAFSGGSGTNRFSFAGSFSVVMEARDEFGATARVTNRLSVAVASDYGMRPVSTNVPFRLGFVPADVAFDTGRSAIYATHQASHKLVRMNLTNGLVERDFEFDFPPERIAITPDGSKMFVALLTADHSSYRFGIGETNGVIAEFNLITGAKTREFPISVDPFDLVATDSGFLIVSSGSGQWTRIVSIRTGDGAEVSFTGTYERARLSLAHAQDTVYASVWLSPSDFTRIGIDSDGSLQSFGDSPYHGVFPMGYNMWALEDGRHVVTAEGGVYSSVQQYVARLNSQVSDAFADTDRNVLVTVDQNRIRTHRLGDFVLESEHLIAGTAAFLGHQNDRIYVVSTQENDAVLIPRYFPARSASENRPPAIALSAANGHIVQEGQSFSIRIDSNDPDGSVVAVNILMDGSPFFTPAASSTSFDVYNPPPGDHVLVAVVRDDLGATNSSASLAFSVNRKPVLALTAVVFGTNPPAAVELTANAVDSDGSITRVDFFEDENPLGSLTSPPFRLSLTNVSRGIHIYRAIASDNRGGTSDIATLRQDVMVTPGDYLAGRIPISGIRTNLVANNSDASAEIGEPNHAGEPAAHSLWWLWTPPPGISGTVVIDTHASTFDTVLVAYSGPSLWNLTPLSISDDVGPDVRTSQVKIPIDGRYPYPILIAVDGKAGQTGTVHLNVVFIDLPGSVSNDNFTSSIRLEGQQGYITASNTSASREPGEPSHAGTPANRSLWWNWTAPANGNLTLTTDGSSFDTVMAVYTGVSLTNLVQASSNDDSGPGYLTSKVTIPVVAGRTYYIAVDGYRFQSGFIGLGFSLDAMPAGQMHRTPEGDIMLSIQWTGPQKVMVEYSTNLVHWQVIRTNQPVEGAINLPAIQNNGHPKGFFRIRAE